MPSLKRRKGGSPGCLTSQLLLFRALRPGTSSNKFRHPADARPLPAQPFAQTPFPPIPSGRHPPCAGVHLSQVGKKRPSCNAFRPLVHSIVTGRPKKPDLRHIFTDLRQGIFHVTPTPKPLPKGGCRDFVKRIIDTCSTIKLFIKKQLIITRLNRLDRREI